MKTVTSELELVGTSNTPDPEKGNSKQWWNNPRTVLILGILYVISPIDVVPDLIPGIGWVDDIAAIAWVIRTVMAERKKNESN